MKTGLVLLFSLASSFAAEPSQAAATAQPELVKKLGSVTWDLQSHKLAWIVQKGTFTNGEFHATSEERFEISPDDAVMARAEELRGFDGNEAAALHQLLDTLGLYCAESVAWWDRGEGAPVAEGQRLPAKPRERKPAATTPRRTVPVPEPANKVRV